MTNRSILYNINAFDLFQSRKCAAIMLLDASRSVDKYSSEMKIAIKAMMESVAQDEACQEHLEVGIMTFNKSTQLLRPISPIDPDDSFDLNIECKGRTSIGTAVLDALDVLQKRVDYYHAECDEEPYVPKLIIITDAIPQAPDKEDEEERIKLEKAYDTIHTMVANRELNVLAVGVGKYADRENLQKLSGGDIGAKVFTIGYDTEELNSLFKAIGTSMNLAARTGDLLSNESFQDMIEKNDDPDDDPDDFDTLPEDSTDPGFDPYELEEDSPLFR